MRKLPLAGLVLLLAAAAHARGGGGRGVVGSRGGAARSGSGRGFVAGRGTVRAAPGGGGRASGWSAPTASRGGSVTRGSAVVGRHASSGGRSSFAGAVVRSGGTYRPFARRVDSTPTGGSTEAPPPYFDKPGALIRTEGQLPVYSDPGNGGTHSVEGGGFVAMDGARGHSLGGAGLGQGRADRTPSSGAGAGGNGVTSNGGSFDPSF